MSLTKGLVSPESPRWLVHKGLLEEGRLTVGITNTNGDPDDPVAVAVYREIVDTLAWEKDVGKTMSPLEIFKGKVSRRRLMIGSSPGVLTSSTGNIIGEHSLRSAPCHTCDSDTDDRSQHRITLGLSSPQPESPARSRN